MENFSNILDVIFNGRPSPENNSELHKNCTTLGEVMIEFIARKVFVVRLRGRLYEVKVREIKQPK